jgi:hypothetical protein
MKLVLATLLYILGVLTIIAGSYFFLILGIWEVIQMIQDGSVSLGGLLWAGFLVFLREILAVFIGIGLFFGGAALVSDM